MLVSSNKLIRNQFFPLYRRLNLHTSSVCDPNLVKWIENTMAKKA